MAYGTSKCAHYSHVYTQNTNLMLYKRELAICDGHKGLEMVKSCLLYFQLNVFLYMIQPEEMVSWQ